MSNKVSTNYFYIKRIFRMFFIPIFAVCVFFGVLFFLTLPKINDIFNDLNKIENLKKELSLKRQEINNLIEISRSISSYDSFLNIISSQTSGTLNEVISFRNKVTDLAIKNNLTIKTQRLFESKPIIDDLSTNFIDSQIILVEVPTFFEVEGEYDDILNFLKQLYDINDLVLIKRIDLILRSRSSNRLPATSIEFVKFAFQQLDLNKELSYENFRLIDPIPEIPRSVLDYFSRTD